LETTAAGRVRQKARPPSKKLSGNLRIYLVGDTSNAVIRRIEKGASEMKILRAAAISVLLVAGPALVAGQALAQGASQNAIRPPPPSEPPTSPSQKEFEKSTNDAYKKSLGNIPDKPPADPWGGAHAVDPPKSTTSAPAKRTKASAGSTTN
jgi:hypothetical protein